MPTNSLRIFQDQSAFPLDDISVASPCPADWLDMVGSDRVRFCASCQKNVFNLSAMRRDEAVELVRATEGKACIRFFRRADGTVLTEDCPVGVALLVRRAKRVTYAAAALSVGAVAAMLAVLAGGTFAKKTCERLEEVQQSIVEATPPAMPPALSTPVMGGPLPPPVMAEPEMGQQSSQVKPKPPRVQPMMGRMVARPREVKPVIEEVMGSVAAVE